jgi:hypothetical protein
VWLAEGVCDVTGKNGVMAVGSRVRVKDSAEEMRHRGKTGELMQPPMGKARLAVVLSDERDERGLGMVFLVCYDDLEPMERGGDEG